MRLAIDWYLERRAAEPALRLAAAVWKFCEVRGHAGEGERWLSSALALDELRHGGPQQGVARRVEPGVRAR